jgi:predicted Zn-dependent protease
LADARSNLGDEAAAATAYAQAVALAPDQAMLRRNYANALIALGRLVELACPTGNDYNTIYEKE